MPAVRGKRRSKKQPAARPPRDKRASLTSKAYEALKQKILVGFFAPGQYLNEADIASALEIGRTPVHQSLQRLQLEGLVKIVPRKGVIIQSDSIPQIMEVLNARMVIEPLLVQEAALRIEPSELEELESIVDRRTRDPSIDFFVEKDRAFHAKLISISRNRVLGDFARTLHERSIRYTLIQMWQTSGASVRADHDHRAIITALKRKDGKAANQAMRKHLEQLKARLYLPTAGLAEIA